MKNVVKSIAIACLVLISTASYSNPKKPFKSVKELIKEKVVYPFFYELNAPSEVYVEYEVNEDGMICITNVVAPNKNLKKYVMQSFDGQMLSDNQIFGSTKKVLIRFSPTKN